MASRFSSFPKIKYKPKQNPPVECVESMPFLNHFDASIGLPNFGLQVCEIPNPGSVKLLADPFCEKHPACAKAGVAGSSGSGSQAKIFATGQAGYVGNCCPIAAWKAAKRLVHRFELPFQPE